MIVKHKVIDTNVLLLDTSSLMSFMSPNQEDRVIVYIPLPVIRELDQFKNEDTDRGKAAREVISQLVYNLRVEHGGDLVSGIKINPNYVVKSLNFLPLPKTLDQSVSDDLDGLILKLTHQLQQNVPGEDLELVTNDGSLILQAESLGIPANHWKKGEIVKQEDDIYKGWMEIEVPQELIDLIYRTKSSVVPLEEFLRLSGLGPKTQIFPNEYFVLRSNPSSSVLAKYVYEKGVMRLRDYKFDKIAPKTSEQSFVMDALHDPNIHAAFIFGPAGTGKTFLSINAGYEQVIPSEGEKSMKRMPMDRLFITRPIVHDANEIGFLPGSQDEKLAPWLMPIYDNLLRVCEIHGLTDELDSLRKAGHIVVQNLDTVRGRTLPNIYFEVDESQNLTRSQAKTLITRMGNKSKIVFTGDLEQIGQKGITRLNNGMVFLSEYMKNSPLTATVYMTSASCVRSPLTKEALRYLP
ncbi:PhoH family protein [Candidatus Woesearchaeota archaeon]|nr:PhoH family protein [Candidatus Woesearchaeota archaeon]